MSGRCGSDGALPLPYGERVGVRGFGPKRVHTPSPASLREATSPHGRGEAEFAALSISTSLDQTLAFVFNTE